MIGRVHSVERPGIRMVIFLSGCPMRCIYCHNPDTWDPKGGKPMTVEEILAQFEQARPFYKKGGITVSGGEPLMQIPFVTELFEAARARKIHTCLDTSGITFNPSSEGVMAMFDRLMAVTDLVMLDIKHIDPEEHIKLCAQPQDNILAFARYLEQKKIPVWIRHVVVPGITFEEAELTELGHFLKTLSNMEKLEVLPYHALGKVKYDNLGMDYVLKDTPQLTKEEAKKAEQMIRDAMS